MAVAFTNLSWWLWSGKHKEPINPEPGSTVRDQDTVKFPLVKGAKLASSSRKVRRKWHSRGDRKTDKEYDVVVVPSDGGCVSGSESDGSDWSIGWLEPHGPGFPSEDETDNSFAVLVPCYGRGRQDVMEHPQKKMGNFPDNFSAESKKYMEQWLSSLQHN